MGVDRRRFRRSGFCCCRLFERGLRATGFRDFVGDSRRLFVGRRGFFAAEHCDGTVIVIALRPKIEPRQQLIFCHFFTGSESDSLVLQILPEFVPLLGILQIVGGFELGITHAIGHQEEGGEVVDQRESQALVASCWILEYFGHGDKTCLSTIFSFIGLAHQFNLMQIAAIEGNSAVAYPKGTDKPTKRETLCDAEQQSGRIGSRIALLFRSFCLYGLTGIERCRAKQMIKHFTHLRDVFAL